MRVGTAWQDITPSRPLAVQGQMHRRVAQRTHDPLTVNAAAFQTDGPPVAVVSCDLLWLSGESVREAQGECEKRFGIPAHSVLIACTHTHVAPCTQKLLFGEVDEEFMRSLREAIVGVVGRALDDLEDAELYAGAGWLQQMGFNRRGLHKDGRADMYHGSWNADFAGVEGPRDGEVPVLFARRPGGDVKLVVSSFSSHPNSLEGEQFYSADFPGAVRAFLRRNLGEGLGVVYLTGAAGNTAPSQLEDNPRCETPWRGEEGWKRSGLYLGSEILEVIAGTLKPMNDPALCVAGGVVPIPMRPWPESFDPEKFQPGGARDYYVQSRADWPRMLREESPVQVRLNVLRMGEAAICTNPAELYVEHGLLIKQLSPARVTLIAQLCDGYVGYVPTRQAFKRGGYSTWPAPSSKLAENAGDFMVEATRKLMEAAFSDQPSAVSKSERPAEESRS